MNIPVLVSQKLVRLPSGQEVPLADGLVDFHATPSEFEVTYDQGEQTLVRGADSERGTMTWQIITQKGTRARLRDDRHTIELPNGSATFEGQIDEVRQAGDVFVAFVVAADRATPNFAVGLDARAHELWRREGGQFLSGRGGPGTIGVVNAIMLYILDPVTGEVVSTEQTH
jgi:hypothetical protein